MRLFQLIPPWSIDIWTSVQPNRQRRNGRSSASSHRHYRTDGKLLCCRFCTGLRTTCCRNTKSRKSASDCRRNHALRKAVREGLSPLPATDPAVREKIGAELNEKGLPALYERLRSVDPKTADRLAPADTQRITRALEVF